MRKVLIIGATSAIAEAAARQFANVGDRLFLVARRPDALKAIAQDLRVRGASDVVTSTMDVNELHRHQPMLDRAIDALGGIDTVLIAHGTLPDQKACEESVELTLKELHTNALSTIALLTLLANQFERQRHGTIVVITSVAGDRGRQSNYVYGAAKAAVGIFLQGLRQRLYKSGVHVATIKPGFVDTPMTAKFKKNWLWARPETVARIIVDAVNNKKNEVYAPAFWVLIMSIIKSMPERVFKRMVI